jgi:hypothetical protein
MRFNAGAGKKMPHELIRGLESNLFGIPSLVV